MAKHKNAHSVVESYTFTVDGGYLRDQARDAVITYFAPLKGIASAAKGLDAGALSSRKKRA